MSSTSKARLQTILGQFDHLFANAHPADVEEIVKELRSDISRRASAARAPGYDGKHVNVATGSGHVVGELVSAIGMMVAGIFTIHAITWAIEQIKMLGN